MFEHSPIPFQSDFVLDGLIRPYRDIRWKEEGSFRKMRENFKLQTSNFNFKLQEGLEVSSFQGIQSVKRENSTADYADYAEKEEKTSRFQRCERREPQQCISSELKGAIKRFRQSNRNRYGRSL